MSIKAKITPELKSQFRTAIDKTIETEKEHGFLMCKDEQNNLSSTPIIAGTNTNILLDRKKCSPLKTQGNFHTHADVSNIRKYISNIRKPFKKQISRRVATRIVIELAKKEGIPISTPSHQDLMIALKNKCLNRTLGTVCTGSDADPNRVDCWTAKKLSKEDCGNFMYMPIGTEGTPPEKWIKHFFDKEVIDLKK